MSEVQLTISGEEREFLSDLLETVLKETRVEEHRTRAQLPSARAAQGGADPVAAEQARGDGGGRRLIGATKPSRAALSQGEGELMLCRRLKYG